MVTMIQLRYKENSLFSTTPHNGAVMSRIDWEGQVGRRFKLKDLHVFFTVAQRGSMARAAEQLRVSQPAISAVIANLERLLGVKLFDRGRQGVELTVYGRTLLRRSLAAFDELRQSVTDIEFLGDAKVGQVAIGCIESFSGSVLPQVIQKFSKRYPNVTVRVDQANDYLTLEMPDLRNRKLDLILAQLITPGTSDPFADELNIETLFEDRIIVAVGPKHPLARRRNVDLADLIDEPWALTAPQSWMYTRLEEAFRARGFNMPKVNVVTFSLQLRTNLLTTGRFVTVFPSSFLRLNTSLRALQVLPVKLGDSPWPVAIVTLKNRTLSPVVERFIEHLRDYTQPMRQEWSRSGQAPSWKANAEAASPGK